MAYSKPLAIVYLDGVEMKCESVAVRRIHWIERIRERYSFPYEVTVSINGERKTFGAVLVESDIDSVPSVFRCYT